MKKQHQTDLNLFWCPTCKRYRELGEFGKDRSCPKGISSICRMCKSNYDREFFAKNRDKIAEKKKVKCPVHGNLITRGECLDYSGMADNMDFCAKCEIGMATKNKLLPAENLS